MSCFKTSETISKLKTLIEIPSVTGTENTIAEFIEESLKKCRPNLIYRQPLQDGRFNVVAHFKGGAGPKILIFGHMDTVSAGEGWRRNPFSATIEGDRIYGRGSQDMKAGIAIALSIAENISLDRSKLKGDLVIAFFPDEEAFSAGARKFSLEFPPVDFGIALEPSFGEIVIGAVGKLVLECEVFGRSAHGSEPQKGINSITEASRFISAIDNIKLPSHPHCKAQPFMPLRINGGKDFYSPDVPDYCHFIIGKQTVPGETGDSVLGSLRKLYENLNFASRFEFKIGQPYYPAYRLEENNPILQKLIAAVTTVTGKSPSLSFDDGVSDCNILSDSGIPSVCYGPFGNNMHVADEWVSIEEIEKSGIILQKLLFV